MAPSRNRTGGASSSLPSTGIDAGTGLKTTITTPSATTLTATTSGRKGQSQTSKAQSQAGPSSAVTTASSLPPPGSTQSSKSGRSLASPPSSIAHTFELLRASYLADTPARLKLIDAFLCFLVALGVVQFAYCVLADNYPFNAFLSGFSATVGQFVLTASLRMQSDPRNMSEFKAISPERAFADFVFGSVLLHVFCVNFIN